MRATDDAESSAWKRAAQSLGAHALILETMLARMREARDSLPFVQVGQRIAADLAIKRVEQDLTTIKRRLMGLEERGRLIARQRA